MNNPFDITKAVDYTNEQLFDYWVDFPVPFVDLIKPTSPVSMIVLGSKGSGKTHVMKYFSFELQKLRYRDNIMCQLKSDGYIGIYWRCSGLNGARFHRKGYDESFWKSIFEYYSEIWVGILLLKVLDELDYISNNEFINRDILNEITKLFDIKPDYTFESLTSVIIYLDKLLVDLSIEVNNLVFTNGKGFSDNFKIHISPTKFFFGLPKLLKEKISFFSTIQFVYLIDEYENLLEYQQKYYNTLLREKENPTSFKIGSRHYGIQTFQTYSGLEEIKEGAEFELLNLDNILRDNERNFAYLRGICEKKLRLSEYNTNEREFSSFFQEINLNNPSELSEHLLKKANNRELKHITKLKGILLNNVDEKSSSKVIANINKLDSLLLQKATILLIYRHIRTNGFDKLIEIVESLTASKSPGEYPEQDKILKYYKFDFIDQLHRENNYMLPYFGFENLLKLASGNPRTLLRMLKEIFKQAEFNQENPFKFKSIISIDSQLSGIYKESQRIFEDLGNSSDMAVIALTRIGELLQTIRFADIPPESSISIFRINQSEISPEFAAYFDTLLNYSYLIEEDNRRQRNSEIKNRVFKINSAIIPKWELSLSKRGVIDITATDLKYIFDKEGGTFKKYLESEERKYSINNKNIGNHQISIEF
ncbi:ORC-CDC6 family AAA ATPase [Flectobacillus rivi]|uniref:ATP-binding protein n=1 Tax=Flectobacillus rivi TaxID=2984209 RepID=A0ABT6YVR1_9BACT|nr:hypothetical protein [Flectobacillus rivi]MDI9872971.1 hypothetical protein [Flectobacillus rivi]